MSKSQYSFRLVSILSLLLSLAACEVTSTAERIGGDDPSHGTPDKPSTEKETEALFGRWSGARTIELSLAGNPANALQANLTFSYRYFNSTTSSSTIKYIWFNQVPVEFRKDFDSSCRAPVYCIVRQTGERIGTADLRGSLPTLTLQVTNILNNQTSVTTMQADWRAGGTVDIRFTQTNPYWGINQDYSETASKF